MPRTFRFFGPFTEAIIPETDETQQRAAEIAHSYCSVARELPEREGITSLSFESANRTLKNRPPEPRKEEQRCPESLKTVALSSTQGNFTRVQTPTPVFVVHCLPCAGACLHSAFSRRSTQPRRSPRRRSFFRESQRRRSRRDYSKRRKSRKHQPKEHDAAGCDDGLDIPTQCGSHQR